MKRRILLASVNDRCYASYRFFAARLAEALEKKGCQIGWCMVEPGTQKEERAWDRALLEAQSFRADAVVDFNSFLPKLSAGGMALPELFQAPFYNYILDHPLYHHKALSAAMPDSRCICLDENHEVYIKKYYPEIRSVFTCPLPGSIGRNSLMEFAERKNRILFCGTYEAPDQYMKLMKELPHKLRTECLDMTERMLACPELTPERCLESGQDGSDKNAPTQTPEQMRIYFLADSYVRNIRRKQIILTLEKEGLPLDLYGNGWDALDHGRGGIAFHPALSYENYVNLLGTYRFALNIMPGFVKGSHDRITCGMRNGALVITDQNAYVKEHYLQTEEESKERERDSAETPESAKGDAFLVSAFSLTEEEKLPELCQRLLTQTDRAALAAERGRIYAEKNHTWETLADLLLADIEKHRQ